MTPTPEQLSIITAARDTKELVLIPLSQGLYAAIDREDYDLVSKRKWFAHLSRKVYYAESKEKGKTIKMHRLIMNAPPGMEVDHLNRDGLDNRKANLRVVTATENKQNKGIYNNNKSGTPGVYHSIRTRGRKPWHAQITRNGRQVLIGRFLTKEEAIAARKEAENAYANT